MQVSLAIMTERHDSSVSSHLTVHRDYVCCRPLKETPIVPPSLDRTKSTLDGTEVPTAPAVQVQPAQPLLLAGPLSG